MELDLCVQTLFEIGDIPNDNEISTITHASSETGCVVSERSRDTKFISLETLPLRLRLDSVARGIHDSYLKPKVQSCLKGQ